MKICPNCGYQNPDEAVYCMKCGAKLDNTPLKQISALENTRLWVMIAYIFSIVMTFVFLILLIFQVVNLALHVSNLFVTVYDAITAAIYALMVIFGFFVFQRTREIYYLLQDNKIEEANAKLTLEWIVIAIIFNGVISGVFLLLSKIEMESYFGKKII